MNYKLSNFLLFVNLHLSMYVFFGEGFKYQGKLPKCVLFLYMTWAASATAITCVELYVMHIKTPHR